jgi:hypothetical protein
VTTNSDKPDASRQLLVSAKRLADILHPSTDRIVITISGDRDAVSEFLVTHFGENDYENLSAASKVIRIADTDSSEKSSRENVVTTDAHENP